MLENNKQGALCQMHLMRWPLFYLGFALLITHELDAVRYHERRVLPLTSWMSEDVAYPVFLWAHVPLVSVLMALLMGRSPKLRNRTAAVVSGFLVLHAGLHSVFSEHPHYGFTTLSSDLLIFGAAICGALFLCLGLANQVRVEN